MAAMPGPLAATWMGGSDGGSVKIRGVSDGEVPALMAPHLARPELADHVQGLLEHLRANRPVGPRLAQDVLVEAFARPDAEEEPPGQQGRGGGGGLGDDRRVDPHRRTRYAGADDESLRRVGDRAEDAPDERTLALSVDPRVEVVGDEGEVEAAPLREDGMVDEVPRRVLLARQGVAE
jgi:hypothetical protein